jgi:hypothetical protein
VDHIAANPILARDRAVAFLNFQLNLDSIFTKNIRGQERIMELGNFSISLAVEDIEASSKFYEKFGFQEFSGDASQNWLIMKNGAHVIGLFQGMFEKNMLIFNPGWDSNAGELDDYTHVREISVE